MRSRRDGRCDVIVVWGVRRHSHVKRPITQSGDFDEGIKCGREAPPLDDKEVYLPPYGIPLDGKCLQRRQPWHMFRSKDNSETCGSKMLQVDLSVAAVIVMLWRVGRQLFLKLRFNIAVAAAQNRGFSECFHSDHRKICELMRRGENGDIALREQRPVVDTFRLVIEITNQGDIYFALQQKLDKAVRRFFSKLDMEARHEFANFGDRLKNERRGN